MIHERYNKSPTLILQEFSQRIGNNFVQDKGRYDDCSMSLLILDNQEIYNARLSANQKSSHNSNSNAEKKPQKLNPILQIVKHLEKQQPQQQPQQQLPLLLPRPQQLHQHQTQQFQQFQQQQHQQYQHQQYQLQQLQLLQQHQDQQNLRIPSLQDQSTFLNHNQPNQIEINQICKEPLELISMAIDVKKRKLNEMEGIESQKEDENVPIWK